MNDFKNSKMYNRQVVDSKLFNYSQSPKNKKDVKKIFTSLVSNVFKEGSGKRGTDLKNYTGVSLELLGTHAIKLCCESLGIDYKLDQSYITHPTLDSLRLDEHLTIKNKIVMMQEDRAWVDKPFCTLKYRVIEDILKLPHGIKATHKDVVFPILCYAVDLTNKTLNTRNQLLNQSIGTIHNSKGLPRVKIFNLSGNKRDSSRDYFYRGYSNKEISDYIDFIYKQIKSYK